MGSRERLGVTKQGKGIVTLIHGMDDGKLPTTSVMYLGKEE